MWKILLTKFLHTPSAKDVITMYVYMWHKHIVFLHPKKNLHTCIAISKTVIKGYKLKLHYRQKQYSHLGASATLISGGGKLAGVIQKKFKALYNNHLLNIIAPQKAKGKNRNLNNNTL